MNLVLSLLLEMHLHEVMLKVFELSHVKGFAESSLVNVNKFSCFLTKTPKKKVRTSFFFLRFRALRREK